MSVCAQQERASEQVFVERIQGWGGMSRFLGLLSVLVLACAPDALQTLPIELSEILALLTSPTTVCEHCSVTQCRLNVASSLKYAIFARVFMCEGRR